MGFLDFITKPIQSLLTPSGTNARLSQESKQVKLGNDAAALWDQLFPNLKSQFSFMANLEPFRQSLVNRILNLSNPASYQHMAASVGNKARAKGLANANYAAGLYGQDSGIAKGAAIRGINMGTQAENDFLTELFNPQHQVALAGQGLNAINNSAPALGPAGSLFGMVQGQKPVTVGPGFLDYAASFLGGQPAGRGTSAPPTLPPGAAGWGNPQGVYGPPTPSGYPFDSMRLWK